MLVVMTVRTVLKVFFEKAASPCPSDVPTPLSGVRTTRQCYNISSTGLVRGGSPGVNTSLRLDSQPRQHYSLNLRSA